MKTSQATEEIVSGIYSIHSIASQVFGVVAYAKWVHPLDSIMSYAGPNQLDHILFYWLNAAAYMALSMYVLRPLAVLVGGVVRQLDWLFQPKNRA